MTQSRGGRPGGPAGQATGKRATAKKAPAKKAPAKKAAAKKAPAKQSPGKQSPGKKVPAKKSAANKARGPSVPAQRSRASGTVPAQRGKPGTPSSAGAVRTRLSPGDRSSVPGERRGRGARPAGPAAGGGARDERRPPWLQGPQRAPRQARPPRPVVLADPRRRLRVAFLFICVLGSVLVGRVVQLQGFEASGWAEQASGVNVREVIVPAERGEIVDRHGNVLVQSVGAYNIIADQLRVTEDGEAAAYALELAAILDRNAASLQEELTGEKRFHYLAKGVSPEKWNAILALDLGNSIYAEPVSERIYPSGAVAGNVLGFNGADGAGQAGLELSYQGVLAGADGKMTYQATSSGVRIPLGSGDRVESSSGHGLTLTLDRDIQWYAEQAIAGAVDRADAAGGNVVVMDVRTGEILAMATAPVVDPGDPGATAAGNRGNRVVEEVYEPGSVFKAVTMAAVLDSGEAGPETVLSVPDRLDRGGEAIHDYWGHETVPFTLSGIIAKSSNVGSILAAERVGSDDFGDYVRRFGFGEMLNLGLPAEAGGRLPGEWSSLDRAYAAFGQGISVTTVQLASAYATIANGGVRMPPTLVSARENAEGESEPVVPDGEATRVISEEAAAGVTTMLEVAMGPEGTGRDAGIEGYRVAGKTGTAQRIDPGCGCYGDYNASFVGFAPADEARFAVAVSLLDPENGNSGGALAGPVFQDVLEFTLQTMGVAPSGAEPPDIPLTRE